MSEQPPSDAVESDQDEKEDIDLPPVPGVPPGVPDDDHLGEGPSTTIAAMDPG